MENYVEYRGYQGSVHYHDDDRVFYGKLMFIPALISYEGTAVEKLNESFRAAVDDYLQLMRTNRNTVAAFTWPTRSAPAVLSTSRTSSPPE